MSDLDKIKKLREMTGVSYSLCLKAINQSKGDIKKAVDLLKIWGAEKIIEKKDRKTTTGRIFSYLHHNQQVAALVELQSETDFVALNSQFQQLGHELAMQIASLSPTTIEELLNQPYIRDNNKKINDLVREAVLKFGENIIIRRFIRWQLGENQEENK